MAAGALRAREHRHRAQLGLRCRYWELGQGRRLEPGLRVLRVPPRRLRSHPRGTHRGSDSAAPAPAEEPQHQHRGEPEEDGAADDPARNRAGVGYFWGGRRREGALPGAGEVERVVGLGPPRCALSGSIGVRGLGGTHRDVEKGVPRDEGAIRKAVGEAVGPASARMAHGLFVRGNNFASNLPVQFPRYLDHLNVSSGPVR